MSDPANAVRVEEPDNIVSFPAAHVLWARACTDQVVVAHRGRVTIYDSHPDLAREVGADQEKRADELQRWLEARKVAEADSARARQAVAASGRKLVMAQRRIDRDGQRIFSAHDRIRFQQAYIRWMWRGVIGGFLLALLAFVVML